MAESLIIEAPQLDEQDSQQDTSRSKKWFLWKKNEIVAYKIVGNYSKAYDASAIHMLKQFNALRTLDYEDQQRLSSEVAAYRKQLITRERLIEIGQKISSLALMALSMLCFFVGFGLPLLFKLKYSIPDIYSALLMVPLIILTYIVLFVIFIFPSLFNLNSAKALFVWHFTVSLIYIVLLRFLFPLGHSLPDPVLFSIGIAMFGNICFEIFYFFFVTVFIVFGRIAVERWYAVHYPLAVLVRNLIDVLSSVEEELPEKQQQNCPKHRYGFRIDLKEKQKQLSGLEVAARCIQWYLPRQLSGGDIDTDTWWKEITQEIANALHDKKRWILTPKEDTQYWLSRSLAYTLTCILDGSWDGLEKIKTEDVVSLHPWHSRLLYALGLIAEAILPFAAFLVIEHFINISTQVRDFAIVGLLIWALITFAGSLDPKFSEKVAAINDLNPFSFTKK